MVWELIREYLPLIGWVVLAGMYFVLWLGNKENQSFYKKRGEAVKFWFWRILTFIVLVSTLLIVLIVIGLIISLHLNILEAIENLVSYAWTKEDIKIVIEAVTLVTALVGLLFIHRRLNHQIRKEADDRFVAAVGLLSSAEASARTGAIYSLYQLFTDDGGERYQSQIAQILCSHIRVKTQEKKYRKKHKDRPSDEIQTTIDLLFRDVNNDRGIYCRSEIIKQRGFPSADLQHAYLRGANFMMAHCEKINFSNAHCEGTRFGLTHFEKGDFKNTNFQGAIFWNTCFEGGNFRNTHFEGATFEDTHFEGAYFRNTHFEGAIFQNVCCKGACFQGAYYQGANFQNMDLQGSYTLGYTHTFKAFVAIRIKKRIGKDTKLENLVFAGEISEEVIKAIDEARPYIKEPIYNRLQDIIKKNEGVSHDCTIPEGVNTGVLENSKELRQTIQKLKKLEKITLISIIRNSSDLSGIWI